MYNCGYTYHYVNYTTEKMGIPNISMRYVLYNSIYSYPTSIIYIHYNSVYIQFLLNSTWY